MIRVGIHPGRVDPASPIEPTTSRINALKARQSCIGLLETCAACLPLVRILRVSRVGCGGCCHCQRQLVSFRWPPVLSTYRNRRTESIAPLPGRPCVVYSTMFHAATNIVGVNFQPQWLLYGCKDKNIFPNLFQPFHENTTIRSPKMVEYFKTQTEKADYLFW